MINIRVNEDLQQEILKNFGSIYHMKNTADKTWMQCVVENSELVLKNSGTEGAGEIFNAMQAVCAPRQYSFLLCNDTKFFCFLRHLYLFFFSHYLRTETASLCFFLVVEGGKYSLQRN